jgi:hypothetical protein
MHILEQQKKSMHRTGAGALTFGIYADLVLADSFRFFWP